MRYITYAAAALLIFLGPQTAVADVTFNDTLFDNADWSLSLSTSTVDGTASASQIVSGGNPDSYRRVNHTVTSTSGLVQVFHLHRGFVYDPAAQGAIESVSWSIDYSNLEGGQAAALVFEQGGSFHVADVFVTTGAGIGGWFNHNSPTLLESDFGNAPDFSASAPPLTFGFFTANSGQINNFTTGYDNLTINITSTLVGDLDGDGFVGINDLNIVLSNWNQSVTAGDPLVGDPSGDGFVGIDDLNEVLGNWNAGPPPNTTANIPEPATLLILLCLGSSALIPRR